MADAERPPQSLVIVVDDDAAVRSALTFTLELEGYQVTTCGTAEDLLRLVLPNDHACLVIDERLPGLSGMEALTELRRRNVGLPAALITTNPKPPLERAARIAGAPIIEKPLLGDALIAWVRSALRD